MRRHTFILGLASTALLTMACTHGIERAADVLTSPSVIHSVTATPSVSATPSAADPSIRIRTPRSDDDVLSPVVVSGTAISDSGSVVVDVLDAQGMELAAMHVPIDCGPACRGSFRARLAFFVSARQEGTVEVYEVGSGGLAEHLVQVGVTLVPGV